MRQLKTAQERAQFRKEHHERMMERARERGEVLPDMPPMGNGGMGQHKGLGAGSAILPSGSTRVTNPRYVVVDLASGYWLLDTHL